MNTPDTLSPKEAAAALGVSLSTVYQMIYAGDLAHDSVKARTGRIRWYVIDAEGLGPAREALASRKVRDYRNAPRVHKKSC